MRVTVIIKSILRDENGAVAIITAVILAFVLLGIAAFAVDIGGQTTAKNELQNAVDAAALAGAIELAKNGHGNVQDKATEAAQQNIVDNITPVPTSVDIGKWSEPDFMENETPYNAVKVTVENQSIGSFFASVLGIAQSVSANATAVVGPAGGMEGLLPIGIQEEVYEEVRDNFHNLITKDNFGIVGPGNWGWLDLAEAYGESASTQERLDWIIDGYPKMIYTGDEVTTDTGTNLTTPARSDVYNKLDEYIGNETVLVIPIISNTWSSGASATITIWGFAPIIITDYGGQSAKFWIEAKFPETYKFISGPVDFDTSDYGVKSIVLVQ